jgi:hypothetical protein
MSLEEVKQVAGNVEAPLEVVPMPVDTTPTVNIPLTGDQKYILRSYQNKLNLLAKQKGEIDVQIARVDGAMQIDMMKIAQANNIDPTKFGFNDNLEIIPAVQPGQGGLPPNMRRA